MCSGRYPFVPTPEELKPQYEPPFPYETQENCPHIHDLGPELNRGGGFKSANLYPLKCSLLKGHDGDCIVKLYHMKWRCTPGGVDDPAYHFPEEIA